ncbi:MAG: hypothetical protein M1840_005333 [Geoglossum simile]|nr:MAG: hypothetical protein M1840_005333 [Geoglossum simile]
MAADSAVQRAATAAGTGASAAAPKNPSASIDQIIPLLKSKNDTSRFVGLAILKSVLDNQRDLQRDSVIITKCWAAISPGFLDRLLRAEQSAGKSKEEARDLVELAVAVIHAFAVLLPLDVGSGEGLVGRCEGLLMALLRSSSETTGLILQTLLTFASWPVGAARLLGVGDWSPLLEVAPQQPLAIDVIKFVLINGAFQPGLLQQVRLRLDAVVPALIVNFRGSATSPLLELLADLFVKLPPEALSLDPNWLKLLSSLIQETVLARPTLNTRKWCTLISSTLLQHYPEQFPSLLFRTSPKGKGRDKQPAALALEPKPFAYLFVSLILIDIRATIPSLLETLASSEYPSTAERLTAGYSVVAVFVGFLVRSLDEDVGEDSTGLFFQIEPDLLLKLRRDIAETMGLTVEFLRDRWDGVTGSGLDGGSQPRPAKQKTPLSLTWDTCDGGIAQDHLVLAAIRTLALWLREDENETLRREASGNTDVFLGLYAQSNSIEVKDPTPGTEPGKAKSLDFRLALLTAFEGTTTTNDGVEAFLEANGLEALWHYDLAKLLSTDAKSEEDISRGIEIIRVLLAVVEHDRNSETSAKEEWMDVVKVAAAPLPSGNSALELHLSLFQLAVELLTRAPKGLRRRFVGEAGVIGERARGMLRIGDKGLRDGAVEVLEGLEGLSIGS